MQQQSSVATTISQNAGCVAALHTPWTEKTQPEVVQLHRVNLKTFLHGQRGRFVALDFLKLDGQARMLNGRLGVKCALKGGVNTVVGDDRSYFTLYDVKLHQYRTVNLATVSAIRACGKIYQVLG